MLEQPEPDFARLTTIRLGGRAIALLEPENEADLAALDGRARELGGRLRFIGRGSNLLADSGPHELVLVKLTAWDRLSVLSREGGKAIVYAGAGVPLPRLLRFCAANGFSGLEGLAGIPGQVGGACAMNAGSFGSEIGHCLEALDAFDGERVRRLGRDSVTACYRRIKLSGFASLPLICGAIFALTLKPSSVILQGMHHNIFKKKSRQPVTALSAGCAFKNPSPQEPAGRLLENAGFRGKRLGGMLFSQKHANFLVNDGSGTPEQALELMEAAKSAVLATAGVALEPEIQILRCLRV